MLNELKSTFQESFNIMSKEIARDMTEANKGRSESGRFNTVESLNESQRSINKILAGVKHGTLAEFSFRLY